MPPPNFKGRPRFSRNNKFCGPFEIFTRSFKDSRLYVVSKDYRFSGRYVTFDQRPKLAEGEFDLEKARHEVFMLGIKGFTHKDKRESKKALAIKLGATPKKKRGKNIKQHLEELREKKQKEEEQRANKLEMGILDGGFSGKKAKPDKKKKDLNEVRNMDYQLGRYKDGIQFLDKKDIESLKKRRR